MPAKAKSTGRLSVATEGVLGALRTRRERARHADWLAADVALAHEDWRVAARAVRRLSRWEPRDPAWPRLLAQLCERTGDLRGAVRAARTAVRLAPTDARSRETLRLAQANQKHHEIDDAKRAVAGRPEADVAALREAALDSWHRCRYDDAAAYLRRALLLASRDPDLYAFCGLVLDRLFRYEEADLAFDTAERLRAAQVGRR